MGFLTRIQLTIVDWQELPTVRQVLHPPHSLPVTGLRNSICGLGFRHWLQRFSMATVFLLEGHSL